MQVKRIQVRFSESMMRAAATGAVGVESSVSDSVLRIIDVRPLLNAKANAALGKGHEVISRLGGEVVSFKPLFSNHQNIVILNIEFPPTECQSQTTLTFGNIQNIHVMRESFSALRAVCTYSPHSSPRSAPAVAGGPSSPVKPAKPERAAVVIQGRESQATKAPAEAGGGEGRLARSGSGNTPFPADVPATVFGVGVTELSGGSGGGTNWFSQVIDRCHGISGRSAAEILFPFLFCFVFVCFG